MRRGLFSCPSLEFFIDKEKMKRILEIIKILPKNEQLRTEIVAVIESGIRVFALETERYYKNEKEMSGIEAMCKVEEKVSALRKELDL